MAFRKKWSSSGQFCAAPNCNNSRQKCPDLVFHRFPKDEERSKHWVINAKRTDLLDKSAEYLEKNCVLCREHFEDGQYINATALKPRLIKIAVPTRFNIHCTSPNVDCTELTATPTGTSMTEESIYTLDDTKVIPDIMNNAQMELYPFEKKVKKEMQHHHPECSLEEEDTKDTLDVDIALHSEDRLITDLDKGDMYSSNEVTKEATKNNQTNLEDTEDRLEDRLEDKAMILKCHYCEKKFSNNSTRAIHERVHSGEKPFQCQECGKAFVQKSHLGRHLKVHTGAKDYECDICGDRFAYKYSLVGHAATHTGDKPYKCDECGKGFLQKCHLMNHITIHTGEKPFTCEMCGKCFAIKGRLDVHKRMHSGERPYICEVCGKRFGRKDTHKNHMALHTGEKPHKCDVCNKEFSLKCYLTSHMSLHFGERTSCRYCSKDFSDKRHLKIHMRQHTGERPYVCKYCSKEFAHKNSLTDHTRLHTGEKPYECHICGKRFYKNSNLKSHLSHPHPQSLDIDSKSSDNTIFEYVSCETEDQSSVSNSVVGRTCENDALSEVLTSSDCKVPWSESKYLSDVQSDSDFSETSVKIEVEVDVYSDVDEHEMAV